MIEDTDLIKAFVEWGMRLNNGSSPLRKIFTSYQEAVDYIGIGEFPRQTLKEELLAKFAHELKSLGFKSDIVPILADKLLNSMCELKTFEPETLESILREVSAHWKRAENTIPAKEYWESFFSENPQLRPAHVVYYDGDPTIAVYEFLRQNNIGKADTSKTEGLLLGFDDNHVLDMENDPRANHGYQELVTTANQIIEDYYRQNKY